MYKINDVKYFTVNQRIDSNGSTKYLHATTQKQQNALYSRQTTTLPMSGNLHHPAGLLGYFRKIHKLLMAKVRPINCLEN